MIRDRHLTPEEAEKYRLIREEELSHKQENLDELRPVIREFRELQDCISALKQAREEQGLSQQQVASATNIDAQALDAIENRRDLNPSIRVLINYAHAVGRQLTLVLSQS